MDKKNNRSIIPSGGGVLQEFALRIKLIFHLMGDRRINPWVKLIPIAGLIYWISPVDLIMGIPGLDAVDDVAVLWFSQYMFIELCPPEVVRELSARLTSNNTMMNETRHQEDEIVDGEVTEVPDK